MKLSTSVFSALLALAITAEAATVTVGNLPGFVPVPVVGRDQVTPIADGAGAVTIGIFSQDPGPLAAAGDLAGLKAAFQQFGNAVTMGFNGSAGLYQNSVTATVGGTGFSGQSVYTVIGDTSDIASASGLFIYDHGFSFVDEPGATEDAVITAGGNLIYGERVSGIDIGGTAFDGFALSPIIPEPSSAMLGLMGLSFLFFRRRK